VTRGARAHVVHEGDHSTIRFVTTDTGTYEITVRAVA
jgi:hypothetical protein